ncbi:hypothetical protein WPS_10190 [Vulcanimicrobium alpinum]|uniref:DUF885 domain-containing protein n=1 Tax=Vulcanimicrobium alpinum TaxID=3016050 RepID=A0AAN2C991_UNVUL|nr:DUF885 domain-containing protein [Vulcanimicrobium alpinum]BDE05743.1 hypothetical protein WPS_10190 [Vulcanimicrobium alpinum]
MLRFVRLIAAAAFALLAGAPPAASAAPSADAAYARLAASYFAESFRASPANATQTGVHDYDALLDAADAAAFAAQLARDHRYLDRLAALDPNAMSPRGALDRAMLENALRDDLLLNGSMQVWKRQPDGYVQTASSAVFSLIARRFAPADVRLRDAAAREEQIPRLYSQARENLTGVDADTALIGYDDAIGSLDLLQHTVPQAFAGAGDRAAWARLRRSTSIAVAATKEFAAYLKRRFVAHPSGTYAIGAANYRARLKYEEGIDIPLDRYLAIGERALAQTHAQMVATAKQIDPHASTQAVLARLYRVHPRPERLLAAAQADLVKLRAFIVARRIIDLPPDASIRVTETPAFLRATTVASMDPPGPLERTASQAYYNVTPPDPRDSPSVQEQYLGAFNDYERPIVSAHEVYPGHYTNFTIDKHLPLTLTEKLLGASSFAEGWAHYGEQMIVDEGWGNGDPRVRLMQLREAIWRNARFVAGVKMHTQGMTVRQAIRLFETQAFLDPASARGEARRGTQDPTYGYYTLGKMEILKLRADYKKKMGRAFTLARFHHELLQYGDPPIPLLRPLLLGAADDGSAL